MFYRNETKLQGPLRSTEIENLREKETTWCRVMSGEQWVRDEALRETGQIPITS